MRMNRRGAEHNSEEQPSKAPQGQKGKQAGIGVVHVYDRSTQRLRPWMVSSKPAGTT